MRGHWVCMLIIGGKGQRGDRLMQLLRRLILLVATGAAIWLAMAASLRPLVTVQRVDLAQRQADTSDDYLAQLGFDDYVEEVTQDRLLQTSNVVWEGLYAKLASAEESNGDSVGWGDRVGPNDIRFGGTATRFFFRPDEIPLDSLTEQFAEQPDLPYYVHVDSAAPSAFIEVKYHTYADEDFSFFTGGGPDPLPPGAPFYPYRNTAPWALLAGLLAYVVLPWRRRPPEAICYPYARIIPGDVISLLFFRHVLWTAAIHCRRLVAGGHPGVVSFAVYVAVCLRRRMAAATYGGIRRLRIDGPR